MNGLRESSPPSHPPLPNQSRWLGPDILRTVAVFLVLFRHLPPPPEPGFLQTALEILRRGGWAGVDIFFVLSGFLVSGLLFKEYLEHGRMSVGRFLIRRAFKIYPPFWFLICFRVSVGLAFDYPVEWKAVLKEFLFIQNYTPGIWLHTWSLAVEEHFYLLLALAMAWMWRRKRGVHLLPVLFCLTAVVCQWFRWRASLEGTPYSFFRHHFPTHLRLDALMFGVLLSYCWYFKPEILRCFRFLKWPALAAGVLLMTPPFIWEVEQTPWLSVYGLVMLYVGAGLLLLGVMFLNIPMNWLTNSVGFMGAHSYSVYLWHVTILRAGASLIAHARGSQAIWLLYSCTSVVAVWVIGIAMARMIEIPALRLRDSLFAKGPIAAMKRAPASTAGG